jgi:hypothetical protein
MKTFNNMSAALAAAAAVGLSAIGSLLIGAPAANAELCPSSKYNVTVSLDSVAVFGAGSLASYKGGTAPDSGFYSSFLVKSDTAPTNGSSLRVFKVGSAVSGAQYPAPIAQKVFDGAGTTERDYAVPASVEDWTYKVRPCDDLVLNSSVMRSLYNPVTDKYDIPKNLGGGPADEFGTWTDLKVPMPGKSKQFFFNYVLNDGVHYTDMWMLGTVKTTTKA